MTKRSSNVKMLNNILKFIIKRKAVAIIVVILLAISGYYGYRVIKSGATTTQYVLASVEKGTLINSISGSGQISASDQIDVKPKASGALIGVNIKKGQEIKEGDILAQIDARDAYKAVQDAQNSLETVKLSLDKLYQPADNYSVMQAENAVASAQNNLGKLKNSQQTDLDKAQKTKQNAEEDLQKAYEDGFSDVSSAFLDLPGIMTGLDDVFFKSSINRNLDNIDWYTNQIGNVANYNQKYDQALAYKNDVYDSYNAARASYDKNFNDYKLASRSSDAQTIESLISGTYETSRLVTEAVKNANHYIDFIKGVLTEQDLAVPAIISTHQSLLRSYTTTANSSLSNLSSADRVIKNAKDSVIETDRSLDDLNKNNPIDLTASETSLVEKKASLEKLKQGPDALDIRSQELLIAQKQRALSDAQEKLVDYTIRVPFNGVAADVPVKKGDTVSAATIIAMVITKQSIAEISLNEIDAAKVKTGQKATLTFDAVDGLEITGEVADVDSLGTVTQGVASYGIKIVFDTQDERIKPGMSVSASIVTEVKQDVLLVSNSALKSVNGSYYVEEPSENVSNLALVSGGIVLKNSPKQQAVQIGLANDTSTEITGGLSEGDEIIVRTIISSTTATQNSTQGQSLLQMGRNTTRGNANIRSAGGVAR